MDRQIGTQDPREFLTLEPSDTLPGAEPSWRLAAWHKTNLTYVTKLDRAQLSQLVDVALSLLAVRPSADAQTVMPQDFPPLGEAEAWHLLYERVRLERFGHVARQLVDGDGPGRRDEHDAGSAGDHIRRCAQCRQDLAECNRSGCNGRQRRGWRAPHLSPPAWGDKFASDSAILSRPARPRCRYATPGDTDHACPECTS